MNQTDKMMSDRMIRKGFQSPIILPNIILFIPIRKI